MALWRLYYHLVWATKERQPFILPQLEPELYGYIAGKAEHQRAILHAIGGIENHLHVVVSIPPSVSIALFVKNLKGSSAHHLTHGLVKPVPHFGWQQGYGVFSLGAKQLDTAVAYVKNQKSHHAQGTLHPALEHDSEEDDGPSLWLPH